MMLPPRFLEMFGPPTPPKIYDTPPFVVASARWPWLQRLSELALRRPERHEPVLNLEPRVTRGLPVTVKTPRPRG